ncbi:MAG: type II toxin-antitoxin system RelE/ParE family toxin [Ekhidna sp.]|uniref:type II toxin-antitoxin system RelE family toxin n=1 Tax=Ekhidna sp. TaxID=2608089 RepID=UPI0032EEA52D
MKVAFRSGFLKDARKVKDQKVRKRLEELVDTVKSCESIEEISNLKKLKGYQNFYRIRIGNYRVGLVADNETLIFSRVLHRKDIYRYFP